MTENRRENAAEHSPTRASGADRPARSTRSPTLRTREPRRAAGMRSLRQDWREEFPYHWRADDLVTRRDTLRFLVAGTGALALATGALAIVGHLPAARVKPVAVVRADELGPNQWRTFDFPDQFTQGIIINLPGVGLVAYSDVCTHLSCAVLYQPGANRLYCPCHNGLFEAATGNVLAGPPTRPLPLIQLARQGDLIYAVKMVER
ncbi:MAG: Rieske 2Fe-2S domain-containing protein [Ktedonobacterales bacterium]|nr:Rieske 2Fe-2S domain-containing protein [Ktedonobacterales bacterium]